MTNLAPYADQAVRHAVDAYIDGRLLPVFDGNLSFETRNSKYTVRDGVLLSAPNGSLLGSELVGWLIEYPSRAEVSSTWKPGARAILVDTRNDGVKGPHIIVTSATRAFRTDRAGSSVAQGGSPADQVRAAHARPVAPPPAPVPGAFRYDLPVERPTPTPAPPPRLRPPSAPPPVAARPLSAPPPPPPRALPRVSPPPPPPPAYADSAIARRIMATVDAVSSHGHLDFDDSAPTGRSEKSRPPRHAYSASTSDRSSPAGRLPGRAPQPPASVPFILSRAFQRGMPLR